MYADKPNTIDQLETTIWCALGETMLEEIISNLEIEFILHFRICSIPHFDFSLFKFFFIFRKVLYIYIVNNSATKII